MGAHDLLFPLCPEGQLPHTPEEQQAVRVIRELGNERVFWLQDPDDPATSAFVAASPGLALEWICREVPQKAVLTYVRQSSRKRRRADAESQRSRSESGASDTPSVARKQAKHTVTTTSHSRQANAKVEQELKAFYRNLWHNSQEAEQDAHKADAFTRERASWLSFAGKQPEAEGAGVGHVSEAIRRATTVGNAEAIRDLQLMLRYWRARHTEPCLPASQSQAQTQMLATTDMMMALRDGPVTLRARYHYLRVESAEQLGAGLNIVRRYHAARLREDYNARIACVAQPEREPPISRKQKGQVRAQLYQTVRPRGVAQRGDRDYETFLRTLKHGKRWLSLETSFGCGIFALLPKSRVPSTYVERTLTEELLQLWIRTLQACSPLVVRMAKEITPLIALFADDWPAPQQRTHLEHIQADLEDTDGPTEYMAELLEPVGQHARVHEITSMDEQVVSSPATGTLPVPSRLDYDTDKDTVHADEAEVDSAEGESDSGKTGDLRGERATSSDYENDALSDEILVGVGSSIIPTR